MYNNNGYISNNTIDFYDQLFFHIIFFADSRYCHDISIMI